jgi:DNA-damage-inducible protein J
MRKTAIVRAWVEPKLKTEVENIFDAVGLSASEAITAFYHNVKLYRGIPFELRLPNATTRKAIAQARNGKRLRKFRSVEALRKDLEG